MATAFQALTRIRDYAIGVRETLTPGSDAAELVTDFIEAIDTSLEEITADEEAKGEPETDVPTKPIVMPERFDFDAFLLDLMLPRNQMRVWDAAAVWS